MSPGKFDEQGIIVTEIGDSNIDKAIDDAIEVGAEEVEKESYNDSEFFHVNINYYYYYITHKNIFNKKNLLLILFSVYV